VKHEYDNGIYGLNTSGGLIPMEYVYEVHDGWIFVSRGSYRPSASPIQLIRKKSSPSLNAYSDPRNIGIVIGENRDPLYKIDDQHGNWLDCIKTRKAPKYRPIEKGHKACTVCLISDICNAICNRKLEWVTRRKCY